MRKQILIPSLLAISLGLVACAEKPNPNLEKARADFIALQNNPLSSKFAAAETQEASGALDVADKAFRDGIKTDEVSHLSYILSRQVDLANATIDLRQAEEQIRTQATLDIAKKTARGSLVTFGDVLFEFGKADLKSSAFENIDKLAHFLKENPERQVLVEGFTDSVGSDAVNLKLSERRAMSVANALASRGVNRSHIQTRGYGKGFPVASNTNASDRALNRRVEVTISNDNKPVAPRRQ